MTGRNGRGGGRVSAERRRKTGRMIRLLEIWLTLLAASVLLSGCALFDLRKDNTFSRDSCLITGTVYSGEPAKGPIVVVACEKVDGRFRVAHHTVLHEPGPYQLLVPRGRYRLFAFEDRNRNWILDPGEPAGVALGDSDDLSIRAPAGGSVPEMAIVLSRDPDVRRKVPFDILAKDAAGGHRWHSTQAGAIMDIRDPIFSGEQGVRGFWSPLEFFREYGANIYFLEPYDPGKIPILLVHGAAGSPQDWRYFIDNLDRSRYQIWIYYYPSGARLKAMSGLMAVKIRELHRKYGFQRLYVTAHSMGGHVARYALAHESFLKSCVKLFVSISTPFGGEDLAAAGVAQSPAVIPSWKDMAPNSEFIRLSFSRKMPPSIRDYLFFGHRGSRNPLRPNNDTTVTLASMLDLRAQSEAVKVFGFDEDHVGILNSRDVLAQYRTVLEWVEKGDADPGRPERRGMVRLRYTIEEESDVPPLWMTLLFLPADKSRVEFYLSPDPLKKSQEMGPVREGTYEVGMLAWGYRVSPARLKVDVGADTTAEVALSLRPQGMVGGQITMEQEKEDLYWGFMTPVAAERRVTSVSLTGPGVQRTIVPHDVDLGGAMQEAMDGREYYWEDFFMFYDIPKGRYELKVEARGCRPFVQVVTVDPKAVHAPLKISLTPEGKPH